jgi:hypothetical protein
MITETCRRYSPTNLRDHADRITAARYPAFGQPSAGRPV